MYKRQLLFTVLLCVSSCSYGMVHFMQIIRQVRELPISMNLHNAIIINAKQECEEVLPEVVAECLAQIDPLLAFQEYKTLLQLHLRCKYIAFVCGLHLTDKDRNYLMIPARTYSAQQTDTWQAEYFLQTQFYPEVANRVSYCCQHHLASIEPQLTAAETILKDPRAQVSFAPQYTPNATPIGQFVYFTK